MGCIWNSAVLISDEGVILNHQRKMVPTFVEKLVWANGDGAGLNVVDMERCGKVGALICGENTNPLARWSLMAQGEQLHLTTWPPLVPWKRVASKAAGEQSSSNASEDKPYDIVTSSRIRTAGHCFEAKCFGVICSGFMDKEMRGEYVVKPEPSRYLRCDR